MNFPFFIAKRYYFKNRNNDTVNIISKVSLFGIAIGTAALILIISVFNGFESVVLSMYNSFDPDIKITSVNSKTFNHELINHKIKDYNSVEVMTLVLEEKVLLKHQGKEFIANIKGVSDNYDKLTNIDSLIINGDYIREYTSNNVCIMGKGIAYYLSAITGSIFNKLQVYLPNRHSNNLLDPITAFSRSTLLPVGVFSVQSDIDKQYVITPLEFVQTLSKKSGFISSIDIRIKEDANILTAQRYLQNLIGADYIVKNRWEQQDLLYKILKTEKFFVFLVLSFILLVASFNIIGSTSMLILDKKKSINIFKSFGSSQNQIHKIFFYHSIMIVFIGMIIGLLIGLFFGYIQQKFGIIGMGGGNFVIDSYPILFSLKDISLILSIVMIIGLLASWYPSLILVKRFFKKQRV